MKHITRLVDDEILDGERLLLIEAKAPEFWPCGETPEGHKRYIHACKIDAAEGQPRCTLCGDFIPAPPGLKI